MLEAILNFVTPGDSLTLPSRFSWRVVTSWITCGWILGIICAIISIFQPSSGTEISNVLFVVFFGLPFALCFYGFLGLAVDSIRGKKLFYPGWYWYVYPIITVFWIAIWLLMILITFIFALTGTKFSTGTYKASRKVNIKKAKDGIRREVQKQESKKFLNEYEKVLMQLQLDEREKLQQENIGEVEKQERLKSLSIRDRILLKIKDNPGALLEDFLDEEEQDELSLMILEASL
jgi:hypothetical protein